MRGRVVKALDLRSRGLGFDFYTLAMCKSGEKLWIHTVSGRLAVKGTRWNENKFGTVLMVTVAEYTLHFLQ